MPKRWRRPWQHNAARSSSASCSVAPQATMERTLDLPGFHYDPIKKKYFKIDQNYKPVVAKASAPPPVKDAYSATESIPNLSLLRQHGLLQRSFLMAVIESQIRGITEKSLHCVPLQADVSIMQDPIRTTTSCETLITNRDIHFVAGIWKIDRVHCPLSFVVNIVLEKNESKGIYELVPESGPCSFLGRPSDSCIISSPHVDNCSLLTCQVPPRGAMSKALLFRRLANFNGGPRWTLETYDLDKSAVFSCAYNGFSQKAVFGMETCGLLYRWDTRMLLETKIYSSRDSLYGAAFDSTGQLLFTGSRKGMIYCNDLRDYPSKKNAYQIALKSGALNSICAFRSDSQIICSGHSNQLLSLDLRMRRPLLRYAAHVNDHLKIPFTVDEDLGVLCSMGQDGCTRLWNLNAGRLVKTIEPPIELEAGTIPSAVFKSCWGHNITPPAVLIGCENNVYMNHSHD